MIWAEKMCEEQMLSNTVQNKLKVLSDVIHAINFCRMELQEIVEVHETKMIPDDVMLKIFLQKSRNQYSARKKVPQKVRTCKYQTQRIQEYVKKFHTPENSFKLY